MFTRWFLEESSCSQCLNGWTRTQLLDETSVTNLEQCVSSSWLPLFFLLLLLLFSLSFVLLCMKDQLISAITRPRSVKYNTETNSSSSSSVFSIRRSNKHHVKSTQINWISFGHARSIQWSISSSWKDICQSSRISLEWVSHVCYRLVLRQRTCALRQTRPDKQIQSEKNDFRCWPSIQWSNIIYQLVCIAHSPLLFSSDIDSNWQMSW